MVKRQLVCNVFHNIKSDDFYIGTASAIYCATGFPLPLNRSQMGALLGISEDTMIEKVVYNDFDCAYKSDLEGFNLDDNVKNEVEVKKMAVGINATKLIERLKCEKRREVAEAASNPFSTGPAPEIRISQIYDGVVSVLEKEPAANVVPRPAPKWPICQNCGRPMVYCGEENTDGIVWKRYSCKDCYNQFCARRVMAGEETWPK